MPASLGVHGPGDRHRGRLPAAEASLPAESSRADRETLIYPSPCRQNAAAPRAGHPSSGGRSP